MALEVIVFGIVGIALLANVVRITREYERGVVFRLGRFVAVKGPGLVWLVPLLDRMVKVDLRIQVDDIPPQDVITKDNVSVTVNAVVYRRITDAEQAVLGVEDVAFATTQVAQTTLRSALGRADLDTILVEQARLADDLQQMIAAQVAAWGVEILSVEIKDVQLPEAMKRALARRAEAERDRRAKIIHAQGELAASKRLAESAEVLAQQPAAVHLRFLQSIGEVSAENNTTIVFPFPMDLLRTFGRLTGEARPADGPSG